MKADRKKKVKGKKGDKGGKGAKGDSGPGVPLRAAVAPTEDAYLMSLDKNTSEGEAFQIVSFFLNGAEYAFEVYDAVEVLRPREVTEVPQVPAFIKGILSVRGEMVPVIDLKGRLGMDSTGDHFMMKRILVAGVDDLRAGFMVDRMGGVKDVKSRAIKSAPRKSRFLKGTIRLKNGTVNILDITKLLDV
jgi:purine-binding chemotaxis protein CheW